MKNTFLAALFLASSSLLLSAAEPRIVPCDQPVKSAKRGLCLNKMDDKDFMAFAPSVSWWYNWHFDDTQNPPAAAKMEFLPMVWGDRPEDLKGLKAYLSRNKPSRVLAINEPNLKGQAFITPEKTAELYKKVKAIADEHNIPVVGPHMALGSAPNESIKAVDPIEKKEVTYTFMTPFLKAFNFYMGDTAVSATAAHTYGELGELKWMTGMMHKEFNKPVWVTEFANWKASSPEAELDYLIQAVDFFERTPYVEGYAWFKERVKDNGKISLLEKESGKLTRLGEAYVNMPVHDPNVFYQLPGKLQAESYVAMQDSEIDRTTDTDGFLEMQLLGPGVWIDYNVSVTNAGTYALKIRFSSKHDAKLELLSGEKVIAALDSREKGWQTGETTVDLPAGTQTLRFRASSGIRLNWLEFAKN